MTDAHETDDRAHRIADSVRNQLDRGTPTDSRRGFLGKSLLAGGVLALGGTGLAGASEHQDEEGGDGAAFDDVAGTDVDVLNYALTLEHLEDAFYREALDTFDAEDFYEAEALEAHSEDMRRGAYEYVEVVGQHESAHVDVLSTAVSLLGGEPAEAGEYDFGVESVGDFVELGSVLENTGVAAYAGAAPFIESPDLLGSALAIHSVEARHAAVLNTLNGDSPFPNAFDPAASQDEVLEAVGAFIVQSEEGEGEGEGGENGDNGDGEGSGNGEGDEMDGGEESDE